MSTSTSRAPGMTGETNDEGTIDQVKQSVGDVAGTAKDEVKHVAGEAAEQAKSLASSLKTQVDEQSRSGLDQLVQTVSRFAEDLDAMAAGRGGQEGMAADLVRQVSGRAQTWTDSMQGRTPGDLVRTVEDFGRRRPGTFLLAAAAAGAAAGRLAKGAMAQEPDSASVDLRDSTGSAYGSSGSAFGDPSLQAPGVGIPGMGTPGVGVAGSNGPGSLGASGLADDLGREQGNSARTGAGQGLEHEQSQGYGAISSADDIPGGPVEFPAVDEALERSGFGRVKGPEVQP